MKNTDYKRNRHSCYYLKYHLVVVIKYRHKILEYQPVKDELIQIAYNIFKQKWNCDIIQINTDQDHVHILFEAPPQVQLSKLINNFKTVSSRLLRKHHADYLSSYFWKPYFWSDSYFIGTVSEVIEAVVNKYIQNQGEK